MHATRREVHLGTRGQWTQGVCEMERKGHERRLEGTVGQLDVNAHRCHGRPTLMEDPLIEALVVGWRRASTLRGLENMVNYLRPTLHLDPAISLHVNYSMATLPWHNLPHCAALVSWKCPSPGVAIVSLDDYYHTIAPVSHLSPSSDETHSNPSSSATCSGAYVLYLHPH
jgi:hypothetical protein